MNVESDKPPSYIRVQRPCKKAPASSLNLGDMDNKLAIPLVQWGLCGQRGRASWRIALFGLYLDRAG